MRMPPRKSLTSWRSGKPSTIMSASRVARQMWRSPRRSYDAKVIVFDSPPLHDGGGGGAPVPHHQYAQAKGCGIIYISHKRRRSSASATK
jgi:hypothetical protein